MALLAEYCALFTHHRAARNKQTQRVHRHISDEIVGHGDGLCDNWWFEWVTSEWVVVLWMSHIWMGQESNESHMDYSISMTQSQILIGDQMRHARMSQFGWVTLNKSHMKVQFEWVTHEWVSDTWKSWLSHAWMSQFEWVTLWMSYTWKGNSNAMREWRMNALTESRMDE